MNEHSKLWAWRLAKALLAAAILVGIGRQFYHDLSQADDPDKPDLSRLELRPAWLALSGGLYLLALSLSACYWYRLLGIFGTRPPFLKAYRAYFLGQLGKYVPGKAWALLLRGTLVSGPEVRLGVAIITAFYEVLTTMAAGALIAALVFLSAPPPAAHLEWHPHFIGLMLLGLCGLPLLPGVFNFLTQRMANRFAHIDSLHLPRIRFAILAEGILLTACGWGLLGLSVWAMLQGVLSDPPALTWATWAQFCGSIGLAYVAGFLAFMLPSGVGVREYILRRLLSFAGPDKGIAAAVLLLRLVWTTAELILAGVVFFLRK
ncbi:MAG TPA: lysylphosphatidylglycerol synthase domain-containing protein [Gemmataceae bacterium]|nr:lysylphosphatidylglycerol synthase domain-containing protein [Gemmataceae bacterium]